MSEPKIALVHDYLVDSGGAERVVEALHEQYPAAPVFTSVYDRQTTFPSFREMDVRPSLLQRLPVTKRNYKYLLPLFPFAFEQFNLSEFDIVISSSSAFAKGVITLPSTMHICYCYTPMRFAWNYHEYTVRERLGFAARWALPLLLHYLRQWDRLAADRVDHFVSVSNEVARRVRKIYRRNSTIIECPVDIERFSPKADRSNYYLIVSRLAPYKRIDIAIEAFNQLGLGLKIAGVGADESRLRKLAKPNVEFLGLKVGQELNDLYAQCRAVIFPGVEDFGIVPLEANAAGRPVIAYAEGGALETVVAGTTGVFFHTPTPEALAHVVTQTDTEKFDPQTMRAHAEVFSKARFKERISEFVDQKWGEWQTKGFSES